MPTPKQVRFHYARVRKALYRLRLALNDAHSAEVIKYDMTKYSELSPCWALNELTGRFDESTKRQLAEAIKEEIMNDLKGIY